MGFFQLTTLNAFLGDNQSAFMTLRPNGRFDVSKMRISCADPGHFSRVTVGQVQSEGTGEQQLGIIFQQALHHPAKRCLVTVEEASQPTSAGSWSLEHVSTTNWSEQQQKSRSLDRFPAFSGPVVDLERDPDDPRVWTTLEVLLGKEFADASQDGPGLWPDVGPETWVERAFSCAGCVAGLVQGAAWLLAGCPKSGFFAIPRRHQRQH